MCWSGCAGAVKAVLLAAALHLMSLSCCVCLSVEQWARCQYCAWFLGMSKSPALIPGLVALIPAPTSTPWHRERSLATFPCHVCVGKAACLQLGTGGGAQGGAVAKEHRAAMQHPVWALLARSLPCRTGWDHPDRAVAHLPRMKAVPAAVGSCWVPGGDAARVARCPGWAPRCCHSPVP